MLWPVNSPSLHVCQPRGVGARSENTRSDCAWMSCPARARRQVSAGAKQNRFICPHAASYRRSCFSVVFFPRSRRQSLHSLLPFLVRRYRRAVSFRSTAAGSCAASLQQHRTALIMPPPPKTKPTNYATESRGPDVKKTTLEYQTTREYFTLAKGEGTLSPPAVRGALSPAYSEDFPTPKASQYNREVTNGNDFDDLYDMTDDDSVDVPLCVSNSVKRTQNRRYPSVVIPSPSAWPTIEKLQKDGRLPDFPLSPPIVSPSPRSLSKLSDRARHVPSSSSAPSLDGSLTSEDLSSISCPSTPDAERCRTTSDGYDEWGVQLRPQAMRTLQGLAVDDPGGTAPAVPPNPTSEMQETVMRNLRPPLEVVFSPTDESELEPISAISIPSPGGFFASLDGNARNTWSGPPVEPGPNTGTAEAFYGVPWRDSAPPLPPITERILEVKDNLTDGQLSSREDLTPRAIPPVSDPPKPRRRKDQGPDCDEKYLQGLKKSAEANFDRTTSWLSSQESYLANLMEDSASVVESVASSASPKTPPQSSIDGGSVKSPGKSVRWADESPTSGVDKALPPSPVNQTFVEGFTHYRQTASRSDAFVQRKARVEAMKLDRSWLAKAHRDQLQGRFELDSPVRPKSVRPVSEFFPSEDPTEKSQLIDRAQKERRALEQIKPVSWNLEATKMLNGGTLLTSPAGKTLFSTDEARVLDLGGQSSCDWAWEVALQHPSAMVHTVYTADQAPQAKLKGPNNHRHTLVPNLWTLPFPSNYFTIISARSLFAHLKINKHNGSVEDEYDLCLKECYRCLKPGGYLEFALLDADILKAGNKAQAISVEFGFNLKTRGYDPAPTKNFLPRLKRAGFGQMRRAWLALPMPRKGEGSTGDASCISGVIGAWAWEKWLLKLQVEMGRDEERLLEGVAAALDEGSETGAAWRYLSGWARKA